MKVEVEIPEVPEGYVVLDQIVLMKVLNADGTVCFRECYGTSLNSMERLGMLNSARRSVEEFLQRNARPDH